MRAFGAIRLIQPQIGFPVSDFSQYDFIRLGRRPFGTADLPMVYAAALEAGGYRVSWSH